MIGIYRRVRRRIPQRGAALVEASVVIPVLVIFLGLMKYTRASYAEKIRQQNSTRENSMVYASHGCQGGGSGGAADYSLDANGDSDAQKVIGKKDDSAAQAATSASFNTATSSMNGTVFVAGKARQISSKSSVYCNEVPQDGDIGGWASFAFNFFKSGLL